MIHACDSCGRSARLTYSPLHEAHFCFECLRCEVPDPDSAPMLRVAEATIPTQDSPQAKARDWDSLPPAPSSRPPRASLIHLALLDEPSARPPSDADPVGSGPFAGLAGESPCPRCHGAMVVPDGPRDWSGQQHVTDCPVCAYPKENT